jgi:death-on-curing protein
LLDIIKTEAARPKLNGNLSYLTPAFTAPRIQDAFDRAPRHWCIGAGAIPTVARPKRGIAVPKNHPFIDGNKPTGFLLGVLFLELNGFVFTAAQEEAANAILALAEGSSEEKAYAAFLRSASRLRK